MVPDPRQKATSAAISFERITKSFPVHDGGALLAIQDIAFDVAPGEIVALFGPSGSGKTTILNIAAGLLAPDAGAVRIQGRSGRDVDWRRVGYMFQDDRLLPWRSALGNVALALEAGGLRPADRRARSMAMLERVSLGDFTRAYPHELSGGMRSRVALARSLVAEPDVLLMDEPFARLDVRTRAAMHAEVLLLHERQGFAILFVTHDAEEAVLLADRIVVLSPRPGQISRKVDVLLPRPRQEAAEVMGLVRELRAEMKD